jgi:hypothetical protein
MPSCRGFWVRGVVCVSEETAIGNTHMTRVHTIRMTVCPMHREFKGIAGDAALKCTLDRSPVPQLGDEKLPLPGNSNAQETIQPESEMEAGPMRIMWCPPD